MRGGESRSRCSRLISAHPSHAPSLAAHADWPSAARSRRRSSARGDDAAGADGAGALAPEASTDDDSARSKDAGTRTLAPAGKYGSDKTPVGR